jgi:hypothetical protein
LTWSFFFCHSCVTLCNIHVCMEAVILLSFLLCVHFFAKYVWS